MAARGTGKVASKKTGKRTGNGKKATGVKKPAKKSAATKTTTKKAGAGTAKKATAKSTAKKSTRAAKKTTAKKASSAKAAGGAKKTTAKVAAKKPAPLGTGVLVHTRLIGISKRLLGPTTTAAGDSASGGISHTNPARSAMLRRLLG